MATKVTNCVDCSKAVLYNTRRPKRCPECMLQYRKKYKQEWYKTRGAPKKAIERKFLREILNNQELRLKLRLDWDHFIGKGTHYLTNLRKVWIKQDELWRIKSAYDLQEWIHGRRKDYNKYFD
ncbi:hypothetical protein KAX03_01415 [Candidatus Bathyarchaeota archaeon]|nr:hypothetical protein [Candidatus Bathyarchaeota archaeon]